MVLIEDPYSYRIIGAAIDVHRILGPGLKESFYEECLYEELVLKGLKVRRQVRIPLEYKGAVLKTFKRMDLVVEDMVVVEIKSVPIIMPAHEAQLLWYLRASRKPVGLLLNFYEAVLKNGIVRKLM
jgi:GxxExxY protein